VPATDVTEHAAGDGYSKVVGANRREIAPLPCRDTLAKEFARHSGQERRRQGLIDEYVLVGGCGKCRGFYGRNINLAGFIEPCMRLEAKFWQGLMMTGNAGCRRFPQRS